MVCMLINRSWNFVIQSWKSCGILPKWLRSPSTKIVNHSTVHQSGCKTWTLPMQAKGFWYQVQWRCVIVRNQVEEWDGYIYYSNIKPLPEKRHRNTVKYNEKSWTFVTLMLWHFFSLIRGMERVMVSTR